MYAYLLICFFAYLLKRSRSQYSAIQCNTAHQSRHILQLNLPPLTAQYPSPASSITPSRIQYLIQLHNTCSSLTHAINTQTTPFKVYPVPSRVRSRFETCIDYASICIPDIQYQSIVSDAHISRSVCVCSGQIL